MEILLAICMDDTMQKSSFKENKFLPVSGRIVKVICKNCNYSGLGKLVDSGPFNFTITLENTKCPKCGKHKLIMDPFVMY